MTLGHSDDALFDLPQTMRRSRFATMYLCGAAELGSFFNHALHLALPETGRVGSLQGILVVEC